MQSPFSDYTPSQSGAADTMEQELPFQSPLADPLRLYSESFSGSIAPDNYNRESGYDTESVGFGFRGPDLEGELSPAEISTAIQQNGSEMTNLKWSAHLPAVIDKLTSITSFQIRDRFTNDIKYDELARAIDRYQEMRNLKPTVKGVMSISTWAALQDDLGFFNYDRYKKIDFNKAISANQSYKKRLWGDHLPFIIKLFNQSNYIRYELPLDDKYFTIMVARWQSQNDILKNKPNASDGMLGPISWDIMRTEIESKFPAYEIKAHIKPEDTAEAARRFVAVMKNISVGLGNSFTAIENKIDTNLRNEKQESSLVREGIYLVADSILDFIGNTPETFVPAALGKVALGLVKKYYEEKEDEERRRANIAISNTLTDLVLSAKNASAFLPDQTVIQHLLDDKLKYEFGNDKKKRQEEFNKFLNLLVELEETVRDSNKIYRIALSKLMNIFSVNTRIVVHCQNSKDMEEWTEQDIYNITTDPSRKRLLLKFSRIHQYINAEEDLITPNQRKILRVLWSLYTERNFTLRELLLDRHVIFRVHMIESYSFSWAKYPVPYDVYIKTLKKGESSWSDVNDILGRRDSVIQFYSKGKSKSIGLEQRNENGLTYKYLILSIVNKVMKNEFNSGYGSKQIGYVESETEERPENFTYPDSEIYGLDESTVFEQETLAVIFPKQPALGSGILPVVKNNKALASNKINISKSGLSLASVISALEKYVDINAIRKSLSSYNQKVPGNGYQIDVSVTTPDGVLTEAIHQFQIACYIDPRQHDGILGRTTLDSLGFTEHGLNQKPDSRNFYGQEQLNRRDVKDEVSKLTNGKFTSSNWFKFLMKPSWLGIQISDGVHMLLLEKLREAESWLLNQPQYKNMTPAALGMALGFNADSSYSAARLSSGKQAMHGFGLAIDINVPGNPWIGAGWIVNDKELLKERTRMIQAFRNASGDKTLPGETVFAYLHSIAQSVGSDTTKAYGVLNKRNEEFKSYLKSNAGELSYWKNSQTFGGRNPLKGFLNLHPDLVYALRQVAGLAWGAMDFGPGASGDIMHFDLRTKGVGKFLCEKIGGYVPKSGHPGIENELAYEELLFEGSDDQHESRIEFPVHEAIEEGLNSEESENGTEAVAQNWNREQYGYDQEDYEDKSAYEDQYILTEDEGYPTYEDVSGSKDWSKAIALNRRFASQLGWDQYHEQINQLILPFSGLQDVSLGEEAFAQAVAGWQNSKGFSSADPDGIIGPHTWNIMKPLVLSSVTQPSKPYPLSIISSPDVPDVSNVLEFNQWHAQKIVDSMNNGIVGENFNSKSQLEKIARGEQVLNVNPNTRIIQILPVMAHISEQAKQNNYNDIILGSFIRKPDENGKCSGHCIGICIDINYKQGNFETNGSVKMVINILTWLQSLPSQYKKSLGFGMPLQGGFFGKNPYKKYKYQPASNLLSPELKTLVPKLGFAFPDNDNHLHIQVGWM